MLVHNRMIDNEEADKLTKTGISASCSYLYDEAKFRIDIRTRDQLLNHWQQTVA